MLNILNYVLMAILLVCAVFLVVAVLLQKTKEDGLSGAIMGGSGEGAMASHSKESDKKLAKITKVLAVAFFAISLVMNVLSLVLNQAA